MWTRLKKVTPNLLLLRTDSGLCSLTHGAALLMSHSTGRNISLYFIFSHINRLCWCFWTDGSSSTSRWRRSATPVTAAASWRRCRCCCGTCWADSRRAKAARCFREALSKNDHQFMYATYTYCANTQALYMWHQLVDHL